MTRTQSGPRNRAEQRVGRRERGCPRHQGSLAFLYVFLVGFPREAPCRGLFAWKPSDIYRA